MNSSETTGPSLPYVPTEGGGQITEATVDYRKIQICHSIRTEHPDCVKCLEAIDSELFQYGVEFYAGDLPLDMEDDTRDFVSEKLEAFARDFMGFFFDAGIVPVGVGWTEDGRHPFPVVMKDSGFITVHEHPKINTRIYKYYRRLDSAEGMKQESEVDPTVQVWTIPGYEPDISGEIKSPIWSLLKKVLLTEKMNECAYITEDQNSKPVFFTEIEKDVDVGSPFDRRYDTRIKYMDGNPYVEMEDDKIKVNQIEFQAMSKWNSDYEKKFNSLVYSGARKGASRTMSGIGPAYVPQIVKPLGVGHKVADVPKAVARGDLIDLNMLEEEKICSIFGVPKSLFTGEGRTVGGVQASTNMFRTTVSRWRKRLQKIMTILYKRIYIEDISDAFLDSVQEKMLKKKNKSIGEAQSEAPKDKGAKKEDTPEKASKKDADHKGDEESKDTSQSEYDRNKSLELDFINMAKKHIKKNQITVQIPYVPYETQDDLLQKFVSGIITQSEYVVMTKRIAGLPITDRDRTGKPNWTTNTIKNLFVAGLGESSRMLYDAVHEDDEPEKDGDDKPKKSKAAKSKPKAKTKPKEKQKETEKKESESAGKEKTEKTEKKQNTKEKEGEKKKAEKRKKEEDDNTAVKSKAKKSKVEKASDIGKAPKKKKLKK